ncbi:hypothetical protein PCS_00385 [Desulfocurvibacter africanus PCS]|uniref:Uncharacterized protein n=1 Tax=Desulfocurvibacter africanus PCS TaxID=1262666 RepID=M5PXH0_DESAF|nr:hypothetical protein [Desulfocurvibacter africanus]EMG38754.1 hypothetical protein PCS_00385 [Desulfocurvibacter africanus PCS]
MTSIRLAFAASLICLTLALSGCGWWYSLTEGASSLVNPKLEYQGYAPSGDKWRLANLFAPVDQRIQALTRELSTIESFPAPEWYERLLARNPWLTSIAAVDAQGQVLGRLPEAAIFPLDAGQFLEFKADWERAQFKSFFFQTDLGPEVCLVQPMFLRNKWVGLIIAQFDPRTLRQFSPVPDDLTLLHAGTLLWPPTPANEAEILVGVDWEATLRDRVSGTLEKEGRSYTWLARYIGDTYLIYAVRNRDDG